MKDIEYKTNMEYLISIPLCTMHDGHLIDSDIINSEQICGIIPCTKISRYVTLHIEDDVFIPQSHIVIDGCDCVCCRCSAVIENV